MESFGTIASFTDENPMRPSEDWMDPPRYIQCLTSRTEGGTQVVLGPSADVEARLQQAVTSAAGATSRLLCFYSARITSMV